MPRAISFFRMSLYTLKVPSFFGVIRSQNRSCAALVSVCPSQIRYTLSTQALTTGGVVWQHGVNQPLIKGKFPPVVDHFEHIVNLRLYKPCTDFFCPLRKGSHHIGLYFDRLCLDVVVVDIGAGEL